MAVTNLPESSSLRIMVQTGTDAGGSPIVRARTFNRIKPAALDSDLYDIAAALSILQSYPLDSIQRVDEGNLVQS